MKLNEQTTVKAENGKSKTTWEEPNDTKLKTRIKNDGKRETAKMSKWPQKKKRCVNYKKE